MCVYSTQRFTPKVPVLVIPKGVYCVEEGDVGEFRYRHRRIEQRGGTKEREEGRERLFSCIGHEF